ncbi:MAG TPA: EF-P beta-lysylation protein EpmB [Gammaproteobacteria bacterium]|nr:EF-P beta-lysylation protein EpmB [Gammaproteobacteria bacterium]
MPIHALVDSHPRAGWQAALRSAIRNADELFDYLELDSEQIAMLEPAVSEFPLLVPRGFAARMRKRDAFDPLLRQVLPVAREHDRVDGFGHDPLGEAGVSRGGLVRKYSGRVLLVTTAACPVHCRYCFRRHFPYASQTASRDGWDGALAEIEAATDVSEVILSGGDPLSLSNDRLRELVTRIEMIDHVVTLRVHSRFPIVVPERVDDGLLELLAATRLSTVVVVHCNHAQEIDNAVADALERLRQAPVTLLNQSVLLRGVNDEAATLCALSRRLFAVGVLPYYLHALDPVAGAAHFDVPPARAEALIEAVRSELPGYLVPRLVREVPGRASKTPLA